MHTSVEMHAMCEVENRLGCRKRRFAESNRGMNGYDKLYGVFPARVRTTQIEK